jgi:hypothetical protein
MRRSSILLLLAVACSSGESPSGGPLADYKPCDPSARAGRFALELKAANAALGTAAYAQVSGEVKEAVNPTQVWQPEATDGACKLLTLPTPFCDPACGGAKNLCTASGCIAEPKPQDVGTVSVTGLSAPLTLMKSSMLAYYAPLPTTPYPPYNPDANIQLSATGGAAKAFALAGRGIAPLVFPEASIRIFRDQPLTLKWTPSISGNLDRVVVAIDVGHHGGIGARIECDVPDNGMTTISASLVGKLIAKGTAGFPSIILTRRTVDSTTLAAGCVDFSVASSVEQIVQVENEISCNGDMPCPGGRMCGLDYKCK